MTDRILVVAAAAIGVCVCVSVVASVLANFVWNHPGKAAMFAGTVSAAMACFDDLPPLDPLLIPLALGVGWFVCSTLVNLVQTSVVASTVSFVLRSVTLLARFSFVAVPAAILHGAVTLLNLTFKAVVLVVVTILSQIFKAVMGILAVVFITVPVGAVKLAIKAFKVAFLVVAVVTKAFVAAMRLVLVTIPNMSLAVVDPILAFLLITAPGYVFELVFNGVEAILFAAFKAFVAVAKALLALMWLVLVTIPIKTFDVVDPVLAFLLITAPGFVFELVFNGIEAVVVAIYELLVALAKAVLATMKLVLVTIPRKVFKVVIAALGFVLITVPGFVFELVFNAVENSLTLSFKMVVAIIFGVIQLVVAVLKLVVGIVRFVVNFAVALLVAAGKLVVVTIPCVFVRFVASVLHIVFVALKLVGVVAPCKVVMAIVAPVASKLRGSHSTRRRTGSSFAAYRKRRRSRNALALRSWEHGRKSRSA